MHCLFAKAQLARQQKQESWATLQSPGAPLPLGPIAGWVYPPRWKAGVQGHDTSALILGLDSQPLTRALEELLVACSASMTQDWQRGTTP